MCFDGASFWRERDRFAEQGVGVITEREAIALGATLMSVLEASRAERSALEAGDAWPVLLRRNLVTGATVMVRRSLAESARPFPPLPITVRMCPRTACRTQGFVRMYRK